jgi:FlaA1/EpsC-like NDP-sugar epimerase
VNIGGTYNLAQLALDFQLERFVLISTDKAVRPTSIMGASKRICELMVHYFAQDPDNETLFTAVRFGNVLGSRGSVLTIFNKQIENNQPITVTHPNMTRYFMSIPEASNLVIHAACMTTGDDIFILEMGEVVRIVDLAERMIRLRGLRPHVDIEIQYIGAKQGEKMHEELYQSDEEPQPTLHPHIVKINRWVNLPDEADFQERLESLMKNCLTTRFTFQHFQAIWQTSDEAIQKVR